MTVGTDQAPGVGAVVVVGRRTPMVLSVARCVREGLARGVSVPAGGGTVRLGSVSDAQQAHVTFAGDEVMVAADGSGEPDVTWTVRWTDPVPAADGVQDVPQDGFAKEVQLLLSGRDVEWREAAEGFWARVAGVAGVPAGLRVACFEDGGEIEFGDTGSGSCRLFGSAGALTRIFEGRSLIIDELEAGELGLDGGFAGFSGLFGASVKVVCGEL